MGKTDTDAKTKTIQKTIRIICYYCDNGIKGEIYHPEGKPCCLTCLPKVNALIKDDIRHNKLYKKYVGINK